MLSGNSPVIAIVWFVVLIAIFWFLLLRPQQQQQKKRNEMIKSLRRGQRVVTMGGLHGTVIDLSEDTALIKVADKTELTVSRTAVAQVLAKKEAIGPAARQPKQPKPEEAGQETEE